MTRAVDTLSSLKAEIGLRSGILQGALWRTWTIQMKTILALLTLVVATATGFSQGFAFTNGRPENLDPVGFSFIQNGQEVLYYMTVDSGTTWTFEFSELAGEFGYTSIDQLDAPGILHVFAEVPGADPIDLTFEGYFSPANPWTFNFASVNPGDTLTLDLGDYVTVVPEPSTNALFFSGLMSVLWLRGRKVPSTSLSPGCLAQRQPSL